MPTSTTPFPIAAPTLIASTLKGGKHTSSILTRDGSDFVPVFNQRVLAQESELIYSPDWESGYSSFDTVSYAIYRFDLTARTGRIAVHTQWSHAPGSYAKLWLGVSNWDKDRWDWHSGSESGMVQFPTDALGSIRHPASGETYIVIALLGHSSAMLQKIWLSCSRRGDWWTYGRETAHRASSPFQGPSAPTLLWKTQLGSWNCVAAPVYDADGILYIAAEDGLSGSRVLYALEPDGTVRWSNTLDSQPKGGGVKPTSPLVDDDGSLYYAWNWGNLLKFNDSGELLWEFNGYGNVRANPAIDPSGNIYIDSQSNALNTKYLHALTKVGTQLWEYNLGEEVQVSSIAYTNDGRILVAVGQRLVAISQAGQLLWEFPVWGYFDVVSEISCSTDGTAYITTSAGLLYAVNADGTQQWSVSLPAVSTGALALRADGAVYVPCTNGQLSTYNAQGQLLWSYNISATGIPAVDSSGCVYVSSRDSRLYALNPDGTLKWWYVAKCAINSSPVLGEDGTLYFMDGGGWLYAIGPGGTVPEFSAFGQVTNAEGEGVPNVKITITGEEPVITDASGSWVITGLSNGNYLVSASKAGLSFTPELVELNVADADVQVEPFIAATALAPIWPMLGGNPQHTRYSESVGPAGPNLLWARLVESESFYSEPAISRTGELVLQSKNGRLCVLTPDGAVRWKADLGIQGLQAGSAPAIDIDGTIYSSIWNIFHQVLSAYSPAGNFRWSAQYGCSFKGSPVLTSANTILHSGSPGGVLALAADGSVAWQNNELGIAGIATTPAAASDGTLYVGNGAGDASGAVFALAPDGAQQWSVPVNPGGTDVGGCTAALVDTAGIVYIGVGHNVYAINPQGDVRWQYVATVVAKDKVSTDLAISSDGVLYCTIGLLTTPVTNKLVAISANGSLLWEYYADGYACTSPPTIDGNGTIYIGIVGALHAVNPDGTLKWKFEDPQGDVAGVAIGADGTLYFGDSTGHVYALGPGTP